MKIRICSTCKVNEPRDKTHSTCKVCHNQYMKDYFKHNPEKSRAPLRRRQQKIRELKIEAKNRPCADCKMAYPHYVMDFDHLNDKKFELATAAAGFNSIEKVLAEMNKCDVVCSNCHRLRTFNRIM